MAYIKIIYQNSPSTATPINAENLNHMDDQIALNDQRLTDLEGAHVSSFNGRAGAVSPEGGDYDIGQIAPLAGATVGQVPVVVNVGTEEDPELKFAMGQGGGGGHTIVDQSGTELAQEPNMTFLDAHLSDNSTDESTDIEIIQSVSESDWENVTEDGLYDVDIEGVDIGPASDEYVEVTADGSKTWGTLLAELYGKIDRTKLTYGVTSLVYNANVYVLCRVSSSEFVFTQPYVASNGTLDFEMRRLTADASTCVAVENNNGSVTVKTNQTVSNGTKITLYYGNKYYVIDLQTTANRCLMSDGVTSVESALTITKTQFTPKVGASSSLATRNFYVTDNRTFLEVHFCLSSTTAIADQSEIMDLPTIAQNKIFQYGIAAENKSRNAFIVSNSNTALVLTGATTAQNGNYLFGTFRMSLLA